MPQSELIELAQLPQFHDSEEASDDIPDSQNSGDTGSQDSSQNNSQQSDSPSQNAPSHISPNTQNMVPQHQNIDQPDAPNDAESPNSSFHFPASVPNNGSQQDNSQQQGSSITPISSLSQNISASQNHPLPQNGTGVQRQDNPMFDGVRRSTRNRTQAQHQDDDYYRAVAIEKHAKANLITMHQNAEHYRKLELQRQANSACLCNSQHASYDTCLQAETTHLAFEEAQHQDMLLSANLETLSSYTDSMETFHCLMAELEEKPHIGHVNVAHALAVKATKDTPWKTLLKQHPERAPEAIAKELASLEKNILERVDVNHPEYETALKEACPGRFIGTVKRSNEVKARGVKQGFKENISVTDGPNFNYYSHVAKMLSVRTLLMRRRRRGRRIAIKDIATAFLQSHKYPPGAPRKYICFKHPITNEVMYYRQHAPIYGENSAPVHWENTLFPFLTDGKKDGVQVEETFLNFERGENEPCVLYLKERDLVVLVYVDDILAVDSEEGSNAESA